MEGIKKMNKAIRILKGHVKNEINIDQIEILLHLAENEPEPVSYSTLSMLMDNTTESISMNIKILGEHHVKVSADGEWIDAGLGLIKAFQSPNDEEDYIAFLTDRGTRVVWMLNELIR
jgi:DNA-binding MarR family transcriptional regulator